MSFQVPVKCQNVNKAVYCKSECTVRLKCGHACTKRCHVNDDPTHLGYQCKKECGRVCPQGKSISMPLSFKVLQDFYITN